MGTGVGTRPQDEACGSRSEAAGPEGRRRPGQAGPGPAGGEDEVGVGQRRSPLRCPGPQGSVKAALPAEPWPLRGSEGTWRLRGAGTGAGARPHSPSSAVEVSSPRAREREEEGL